MQRHSARRVQRFCGIGLVALSTALLVHGKRASLAQALYFQSKYGPETEGAQGVLRRNQVACRLYPFNVHAFTWTAQRAYREALVRTRHERETWFELAEWWCDRGLRLHPRRRELQYLKARLLSHRDVPAAARQWEAYVDWHYWEPANHVFLAELYAQAGDREKTQSTLALLKVRPRDYKEAQRRLDAIRPPGGESSMPGN